MAHGGQGGADRISLANPSFFCGLNHQTIVSFCYGTGLDNVPSIVCVSRHVGLLGQ